MQIAIQASDLDSERIDGTRVYLLNMLNRFGALSPDDDFLIYHRNNFNPHLEPKNYSNYKIIKKEFPLYWTQTRFAFEMFKNKPDRLWMPMQALPFFKSSKLNCTVTIHDLAFKFFPEFFPKKDLRRLNLFTDFAVKKSDKIIAVSESTRNDILKFYPNVKEEKIKVIYHGFDSELFQKEISEETKNKTLISYKLKAKSYILYVGALQPRKNLKTLISAFETAKTEMPELKLVLAGEKAWMWEDILDQISKCKYKEDIVITGILSFDEIVILYKNASLFVFPSLYEGFGIPVLEAMAAGIPVISARNSSLVEVGGDAAAYFDSLNSKELAEKIIEVLSSEDTRKNMIENGNEQIKKFSWDKCARETIEFIKK